MADNSFLSDWEFLKKLDEQHENEKKTTQQKIGSRQRAQLYKKYLPEALDPKKARTIQPNRPTMLYRVDVRMSKSFGDAATKQLHDFERHGQYFGLVTNAELYGLPQFTLHANYGVLKVSIQMSSMGEVFSNEEMDLLDQFQTYLKDNIYEIKTPVLKTAKKRVTLIAPLVKDRSKNKVDWQLIQCLINLDDKEHLLRAPSSRSRKEFQFQPDNYTNKIVIPWYQPEEKLCVISVTKNLTAQSALIENSNQICTYENYFKNKYGVTLYHPKLPLIECKPVGKQLNFLTKKVDKLDERERKLLEEKSVCKLCPELVNIHLLPASLYIQGKYLPSILHRINLLLVANEIRMNVAKYFNWDVDKPKEIELTQNSDSDDDEDENPSNIELKANAEQDNVYASSEPSTYKSKACDNLVDIETIKSYQFDKNTDFSRETGPSMQAVMQALTLSNAQDPLDLETFEVAGDSVFKLFVTLHVYSEFPHWDEGQLTQIRAKLLSNLHLYQLGKAHGLAEILSSSIFIPDKSWLPSGFSVSQNFQEISASEEEPSPVKRRRVEYQPTTYTHFRVADKSVADCMGALIGVYYANGGIDGALRAMDYLGLRGPLKGGSVTKYSRQSCLTRTVFVEPPRRNKTSTSIIPFLGDLEETICYKFKDPWLAVQAFSHASCMDNRELASYERLEFIGDAILDFFVTNYILKETGIRDPGQITDLRSALVNNVTFGTLAVRYGFHTCLKYDSKQLSDNITKFVACQQRNDHSCSTPYKLISESEVQVTVEAVAVPKVLGDLFESVAGAVFVDSGMSLDTVWKVFYRLMKTVMEEVSKNISTEELRSPVRLLCEKFGSSVKFEKSSEQDSKYSIYLKVPCCEKVVRGVGSSIKQAKHAAAKYALWKHAAFCNNQD